MEINMLLAAAATTTTNNTNNKVKINIYVQKTFVKLIAVVGMNILRSYRS